MCFLKCPLISPCFSVLSSGDKVQWETFFWLSQNFFFFFTNFKNFFFLKNFNFFSIFSRIKFGAFISSKKISKMIFLGMTYFSIFWRLNSEKRRKNFWFFFTNFRKNSFFSNSISSFLLRLHITLKKIWINLIVVKMKNT